MASDSDKLRAVHELLVNDRLAVDFQISMLVAAHSSYRHDTVLRPFPPLFVVVEDGRETERNHSSLGKCLDMLPPVSKIADSELKSEDISILHWLLKEAGPFTLSMKETSFFSHIKSLTGMVVDVPEPNYVLEVNYNEVQEAKFREKKQGRDVHYAFHGSRVENFHSILHYGLHSHMNKNSLFGHGTYLSSELSVSMPYAPCGKAWTKSLLGDNLSCVAVCEIVDDASVKCQVKGAETNTSVRSRARASGSMGGDVPEKYYVVQNNEVLRIKYIIVYSDRNRQLRPKRWTWLYKHKFELMIALYAVLLLSLGIYNSKLVQSYLKRNSR